jgi:hypothetical protein
MTFEYKCVGGPERPKRLRGAWSRSDRVALAMQEIIDSEAVDGWEYLRTDLVPVEEKASFLGRTQEVHRAVLIFRRESVVERPAQPARPRLAAADARSGAAMPENEVPLPGEPADAREARDGRIGLSAERGAPPPPRRHRPPTGLG